MEFVRPFARTVVQSAKPEQSQADNFGLPALCLSNKKCMHISEQHLRQMVAVEHYGESTALSQLFLVDSTALFAVTYSRCCVAVTGTPDLAPLQALKRVEGIYHCFRLLRESVTDNAMLLEHSNDVALELVSSSEEDEDNHPSALLSAAPGGTSAAAAGDKVSTLHVVIMDSVHCPDAGMSSGMAADGSVAYSKTSTTLYKQAEVQEPTPKTSSRTASKASDNSGKWIGTATMASRRPQRSGVMNRKSASRDESPSHRRRPSFDTMSSASCSPNDHRADDAAPRPHSSTTLGDCEARHPYALHGPASAEGAATLSPICIELGLANLSRHLPDRDATGPGPPTSNRHRDYGVGPKTTVGNDD
jgi:hypothetical protein